VSRLTEDQARAYWRRNISLVIRLLVIWFAVSYGCGILLFDLLNQVRIGGYKLGFWFAQQGSMYVFIVLIFYYVRKTAALDREFDLHDKQDDR
jgi:putative solute:sodium symporter small subunit